MGLISALAPPCTAPTSVLLVDAFQESDLSFCNYQTVPKKSDTTGLRQPNPILLYGLRPISMLPIELPITSLQYYLVTHPYAENEYSEWQVPTCTVYSRQQVQKIYLNVALSHTSSTSTPLTTSTYAMNEIPLLFYCFIVYQFALLPSTSATPDPEAYIVWEGVKPWKAYFVWEGVKRDGSTWL